MDKRKIPIILITVYINNGSVKFNKPFDNFLQNYN